MVTQILEGTWEEIAEHAKSFAGKKLRLTVLEDESTAKPKPNEGMLEALRKIKERHKNMPESSGKDTLRLIREARSGGMFDDESGE
jgi:hypothetical protein